MRRNVMLTSFVAMLLLLVGCATETNPFDGSPTHLSLELERSINLQSLIQDPDFNEPEVAYVRIERSDEGPIVYSVLKEAELETNTRSSVIDIELPAKEGYSITVLILSGDQFLEMGMQKGVNAPAKTITSLAINMEKPSYTLEFSEQVYGGDGVDITIPKHQRPFIHADVLFGINPWQINGIAGLWATNSGMINPTGWLVPELGFYPKPPNA